MKFGPEKTKSLTFSKRRNVNDQPPIFLDGIQIHEYKYHKHLGLYLSTDLSWNKHIEETIISCSRRVDLMRNLKFKLDRKSLEQIYYSFIRPKLEYGHIILAGAPACQLHKYDKLESEIFRIITGATQRSSRQRVLGELSTLPLAERRRDHVLYMFYKIQNNLTAPYLSEILGNFLRPNNYTLRNVLTYIIPNTRSQTYLNSYFPYAIKLWNNLTVDQRNSQNLTQFKSTLHPRIKKNKLLYYGERWPNVQHTRLRIGCSKLNNDLCRNLHVIDNPNCMCGFQYENAEHFFFDCPLYNEARNELLNGIREIINLPITLNLLLYGDPALTLKEYKIIFHLIHKFIIDTNRFT